MRGGERRWVRRVGEMVVVRFFFLRAVIVSEIALLG